MKLYNVMLYEDGYNFEPVYQGSFSTKEKAIEYLAKITDDINDPDFYIEEVELDNPDFIT